MNYNLLDLGWDGFYQKHFEPFRIQGFFPARVSCQKKCMYVIYSEKGDLIAEVSGKFRFDAQAPNEFPTIGDWVVISMREKGKAIIHSLLPRKTCFSRKVAWTKTDEQILAANIDVVFLVSGMDREFNVRRIERYLTQCHNRNLRPVIVLNKSDLCSDISEKIFAVESIAFDVPIHPMSALRNAGVEVLHKYLTHGRTGVLLGSSGIGKSTIINRLLEEERLPVDQVSTSTGKGKHVTVHRELLLIPTGGLVIDTPGLRELQLWGDEENLKSTFRDIELLAQQCRFRDCKHTCEPGCAVKNAITEGNLDMGRYKNFLKMQRELAFLATRQKQKSHLSKHKIRRELAQRRKDYYPDLRKEKQ